MKQLLAIIALLLTSTLFAQQPQVKTYPAAAVKKLELRFDFPKTVKLSTWNRNEVQVTAYVSINDGENNDAFQLLDEQADGVLKLKNIIKDMDKIPHTYKVISDGEVKVFRSKEDMKEFRSHTGGNKFSYSDGVDMEIKLEIKVPESMAATYVESKYGVVELVNFQAPVEAEAKFGSVDATLSETAVGKLSATTRFGQIYTNMNLKLTSSEEKNFYTSITATPGKGPSYILTANYGNLYIRKAAQ